MIALSIAALAAGAAMPADRATALDKFPEAFLGRWGDSPEGCSPGAIHGGVTIAAKSILDGEFTGKVRSISRKLDGSLQVVSTWDAPEEVTSAAATDYRLSADGMSLIVTESTDAGGDTPHPMTLIRCKTP